MTLAQLYSRDISQFVYNFSYCITFVNWKICFSIKITPKWFNTYEQYEIHFLKVGDAKRNENIPSREESVEYRRFSRRWISQLAKQKLKHVVTVQWDNGNRAEYELSSNCLRLFDNGPSGKQN